MREAVGGVSYGRESRQTQGNSVMFFSGIAFFLLALMAFPAWAQQACTQIGCTDGLVVSMPMDHRWTAGEYIFDFSVDGRQVRCVGALPLKPCGQNSVLCDGEGMTIVESGCALPEESHGFGDIVLDTSPEQVILVISRNGKAIAHGDWKPEYLASRPNGPGCDPICRQATVPLRMDRME